MRMDERMLTELLECSVCLDQLDHSSKVLPCQHTFCRRCLEEIVSAKDELRCPECRFLVECKVDELPPNILLVRLLEGIKTSAAKLTLSSNAKISASSSPVAGSSQSNVRNTHRATMKGPIASGNGAQPSARALYNYDAKEPGDLSFKKGDVIVLIRKVDENWLQGQLGQHTGFFPGSYVQVINPLPNQDAPSCRALFDFEISDLGDNKDCLFFKKDDVITVVRRVDDNWAEGKLGDRIGIFPVTFADMNDAAKRLLSNAQPHVAKSSAVTTATSSELIHSAFTRCLTLLSASTRTSTASSHSLPNSPSAMTKTAPPVPWADKRPPPQHRRSLELDSLTQQKKPPQAQKQVSVYVAMYSYKPRKPDELELSKGQYYTVAERCQDGWFRGTCLQTPATGVFPGNYVQLVKLSPSKTGTEASQGLTSRSTDVNTETPVCENGKATKLKSSSAAEAGAAAAADSGAKLSSMQKKTTKEKSHRSHQRKGKRHAAQRSHSHRGSNTANHVVIPPPNTVIGAEGGIPVLDASEKTKEKKEKAPSNHLMKRLGTSIVNPKARKSRTPPPSSTDNSFHLTAMAALSSCATIRTDSSVPSDSDSQDEKSRRPIKSHRKCNSLDSAQVLAGDPSPREAGDSNSGNCETGKPLKVKRERYRCVVAYPSQSELELDLKLGDLIFVHKKREDGWFKGTLQRTGKAGLFPSSFVESY